MPTIIVPKGIEQNKRWRIRLLERADTDLEFREHLMALSARSCVFWINTFAFTYKKADYLESGRKRRAANPHHPFVTWPIQDHAVDSVVDSILNKSDILIDKSRDMGATWIICAALLWFWLFVPDVQFLLMSRKEELVDKPRNINTIFGKFDYMLEMLPGWMLPARMDRAKMKLYNLDNGSQFDGESTNKSAGRSQRYDAALLDEFAMVESGGSDGMEIARSLADTTDCRIYNSTPKGPETAFSKIRRSGTTPVLILHWSSHPEKAMGRRRVVNHRTGAKQWTSPWYERECTRRGYDKIDIAQNLDINHIGAGENFFDLDVIDQLKLKYARDPDHMGTLVWDRGIHDEPPDQNLQSQLWETTEFDPMGGDRTLRLWCDLIEDPFTKKMRPRQDTIYVVSGDISHGTGASNTVLCVGDALARKKVAEWAFGTSAPHVAARMAMALAYWFGGAEFPPLIIFENNGGAGMTFGHELNRLRYRRVWQDRALGTPTEKLKDRWGWTSSRGAKEFVLGLLRKVYQRDEFENPSLESYTEAEMYVFTRTGSVEPADVAFDATARATHGDRVIADALLMLALRDHKRFRVKMRGRSAPASSFAARRAMRVRRRSAHGDLPPAERRLRERMA